MTTGSSARNRNGGSIRACSGTCTSNGQASIISPASEATPSTSAERAPAGPPRPVPVRSVQGAAHGRLMVGLPSAATTSSTSSQGAPSTLVTCGANDGDSATTRRTGPGGDHLALGEHDHVVGGPGDELHVVGGHQHRVPVGGEVPEDAGERVLGQVVEPPGRLVEQQHRRAGVEHQRQRQREPLPLGQVPRVDVVGDAGDQPVQDPRGSRRSPRPQRRTPRPRSRGRAGRRRSAAPARPGLVARPRRAGPGRGRPPGRCRRGDGPSPGAPRAATTSRSRCAPSAR